MWPFWRCHTRPMCLWAPSFSYGWEKNKAIPTIHMHLVPSDGTRLHTAGRAGWLGITEDLVISQFPGKRSTFQSFLTLCFGLISNQENCLPLPPMLDIQKCRNRLGSNLKVARKLKLVFFNTKYKHFKRKHFEDHRVANFLWTMW